MRTTMDKAGRVVVPRQVREEMGLLAGGAIDVQYRDGRIEIELAAEDVRLVERDGFLAAEVAEAGPAAGKPAESGGDGRDAAPLTDADVRELLERGRR